MIPSFTALATDMLEQQNRSRKYREHKQLTDEILHRLEECNMRACELEDHLRGIKSSNKKDWKQPPCPACIRPAHKSTPRCVIARRLVDAALADPGDRRQLNDLALEYGIPIRDEEEPTSRVLDLLFEVQAEIASRLRQAANRPHEEKLDEVLCYWDGGAYGAYGLARVVEANEFRPEGERLPPLAFARRLADRERDGRDESPEAWQLREVPFVR